MGWVCSKREGKERNRKGGTERVGVVVGDNDERFELMRYEVWPGVMSFRIEVGRRRSTSSISR